MVGMFGFGPKISCSQNRRDNQATLHPDVWYALTYTLSYDRAVSNNGFLQVFLLIHGMEEWWNQRESDSRPPEC